MNIDPNIKKVRVIQANSDCLCSKYINANKTIVAGFMDGSVILYNIKNLKQQLCLADIDTANINNAVTGVSCDNKYPNLLTCTYSGGLIKIWDYLTGHCLYTIKEKRQTYGAVYHRKRPKFFTFGDDGKIYLYDSETKQREYVYQKSERMVLDGHVSKIFSLRFNPVSPNEFLTGGWDSTLYFWDVRCQNSTRYISDVFMAGDGILFNKQGTELITCEWKREEPLKTWDYNTGKLIQIIKPDVEVCHLYCGDYLDDHIIAVGGSDSNMLRLISLKSTSTISYIKGLPSGVYSMDLNDSVKKSNFNNSKYDEFVDLPAICFSSGKCVYEARFK